MEPGLVTRALASLQITNPGKDNSQYTNRMMDPGLQLWSIKEVVSDFR